MSTITLQPIPEMARAIETVVTNFTDMKESWASKSIIITLTPELMVLLQTCKASQQLNDVYSHAEKIPPHVKLPMGIWDPNVKLTITRGADRQTLHVLVSRDTNRKFSMFQDMGPYRSDGSFECVVNLSDAQLTAVAVIALQHQGFVIKNHKLQCGNTSDLDDDDSNDETDD